MSRLYDVPLGGTLDVVGQVCLSRFVDSRFLPVLESSKRFHSRGIDDSHHLDIRTLIELQFAPLYLPTTSLATISTPPLTIKDHVYKISALRCVIAASCLNTSWQC